MTPRVKSFFEVLQCGAYPDYHYRKGKVIELLLHLVAQMRGSVTPFWRWYFPPRSR